MLAPRFTIRAILAVMAGCAVLFVVMGMGVRGQTWAWAMTIGVASLAVAAVVHAACFMVVWCFARLSPFAEARTPAALPAPTVPIDEVRA